MKLKKRVDYFTCANCGGSGQISITGHGAFGEPEDYTKPCPVCLQGVRLSAATIKKLKGKL